MENDNIINGNCWVACFDILGFRHFVEVFSDTPSKPYPILETYQIVLNQIKRYNVPSKWFSDTFLVYTPNDSRGEFCNIESASSLLFRSMFTKKIPLRGCLTCGRFYVDEEKSIFFGEALNEAYNTANDMDWIGFVFSSKAKNRLIELNSDEDGKTCWDVFKQYYYREYKVPWKENLRENARPDMLPVYNMNVNINTSDKQARKHQQTLWNSLITMWKKAQIILCEQKVGEEEKKRVARKYQNTGEFLQTIYPSLNELGIVVDEQ